MIPVGAMGSNREVTMVIGDHSVLSVHRIIGAIADIGTICVIGSNGTTEVLEGLGAIGTIWSLGVIGVIGTIWYHSALKCNRDLRGYQSHKAHEGHSGYDDEAIGAIRTRRGHAGPTRMIIWAIEGFICQRGQGTIGTIEDN